MPCLSRESSVDGAITTTRIPHRWTYSLCHGPLARSEKIWVAHAPGMPGTFSSHRGLAIPTCITTRAWRTWRDACGIAYKPFPLKLVARKTFPAFPAHWLTFNGYGWSWLKWNWNSNHNPRNVLYCIYTNGTTMLNSLPHIALDYVNAGADHDTAPRQCTNSP